jgi:hypothetical protein
VVVVTLDADDFGRLDSFEPAGARYADMAAVLGDSKEPQR